MAVHATALISLDEARQILGLRVQSEDAAVERAVDSLTQTFEWFVRGPLVQRTLTDYRIDGNGKAETRLPLIPTQSITKVEIRFPSDDSISKSITDTSKFVVKSKAHLLMKEDVLIRGNQNILLTHSAGYASTDIELATAREMFAYQLKHSWRMLSNNEHGIVSRSYPDGTQSFFPPHRLLKEVKDGLAPLRNWER